MKKFFIIFVSILSVILIAGFLFARQTVAKTFGGSSFAKFKLLSQQQKQSIVDQMRALNVGAELKSFMPETFDSFFPRLSAAMQGTQLFPFEYYFPVLPESMFQKEIEFLKGIISDITKATETAENPGKDLIQIIYQKFYDESYVIFGTKMIPDPRYWVTNGFCKNMISEKKRQDCYKSNAPKAAENLKKYCQLIINTSQSIKL